MPNFPLTIRTALHRRCTGICACYRRLTHSALPVKPTAYEQAGAGALRSRPPQADRILRGIARQFAGSLKVPDSPDLRSCAVVSRLPARSGGFFPMEAELKGLIQKFLADQSGATAIEYGLIAAGISL